MSAPLPKSLVSYTEGGYPQAATSTAVAHPIRTAMPARRVAGLPALAAGGPQGRRRVRWFVLAAAVVVAVLLVAGAVVVTSSGPSTAPQEQVAAWFAALARRDGATLAALGACRSNPLCTTTGLTTGYQPPEHVQVGASRPDERGKDSQTVAVTYNVGGISYDETVGVTRYRQGFFGHRWLVTEPPGGWLDVRSGHWTRAQLAGTTIQPSAPDTNPTRLWAPPGLYTITTLGDELFDPANVTVTVAGGQPRDPVTLPTAVKAGILEQVNQQIHQRIDQCAAQPTFRPDTDPALLASDTCPFSHDSPYAITDRPRWTIRAYPTVELGVDEHGTVTVHTTTPGKATISYQWTLDVVEPRRWTTATTTVEIIVRGSVATDDNKVTWTSG